MDDSEPEILNRVKMTRSRFCYSSCAVFLVLIIGSCLFYQWYSAYNSPVRKAKQAWERQDIRDYEIQIEHNGLGVNEYLKLTICENEVTNVECTVPTGIVCSPDVSEYPVEIVESYTVENLFQRAFENDGWFCDTRFDPTYHYPSYTGCFFIEGEWIKVVDFQPITCDVSAP